MKKIISKLIIALVFVLTIVMFLIRIKLPTNQKVETSTFFALDTSISISIYDQLDNVDEILNSTKELVLNFENKLSKTIKNSDVNNINNENKGDYIEISLDTAFIFKLAKEFYDLTDNRFDISIGGLVDYWTNLRKENIKPNENEITRLLQTTHHMDYILYYNDGKMNDFDSMFTGITIDGMYNYMEDIDNLKNNYEYKYYIKVPNNNQSYDLGAIAKGYIADYIKYYLKENGIHSAIINLGGNVLCMGDKQGKDFVVGIKKPFYEDEIITKVNVKDTSVTTSGIYERFIKYDNDERVYHHIIDNNTGYPTDYDLLSATIITPLSIFGDSISTICILYSSDDLDLVFDKIKSKFNIGFDTILIDKEYNIIS